MKALSLTQPWATLVALGAKTIETRSWATDYRGWLAIHASQGVPREAREFANQVFDPELYAELFATHGYHGPNDLPFGRIVAVCNLHAIGKISRGPDGSVHIKTMELPLKPGDPEIDLGDYTPGRYGWRLTNVGALQNPIACRGALGTWKLPEDLAEQLEAFTWGKVRL